MFDYGIIFLAIEKAKLERDVRERYWATLPKREAEAARAKWDFDQQEARRKHERDIALAEASRPRNFWGK